MAFSLQYGYKYLCKYDYIQLLSIYWLDWIAMQARAE